MAEKKLISCIIVKSMLDYVEKDGKDPKKLLKGLPYPEEYFKSGFNFIEESVMIKITSQLFNMYGTYEISKDIMEHSIKNKKRGFIDSAMHALLSTEGTFPFLQRIGGLIDRTLDIRLLKKQKGCLILELKRKKGLGSGQPGQYFSTIAQVRMLANSFGEDNIKTAPLECFLPIDKLGPMGGRSYKTMPNLEVEEKDLKTGKKRTIGKISKNGTFTYNGTKYGSDRIVIELTWTPSSKLKRLKTAIQGFRTLKQLIKQNSENTKKLNKSLKEVQELNQKLSLKNSELTRLKAKLEENNKELQSSLSGKESNLTKRYKELKKEEAEAILQEQKIMRLKNEITNLGGTP